MRVFLFCLLMSVVVLGAGEPMVLKFNTVHSKGTTISIPLGTFPLDVTVDWGDGTVENLTTAGFANHTYATNGIYMVKITGPLKTYGGYNSGKPENLKSLVEVVDWGDLGTTSLKMAFFYCSNLTKVPDSLPGTVTNVSYLFYGAQSFNQDISSWDVSSVKDFSYMFAYSGFNKEIGGWDVSSATNMSSFFEYNVLFNQDISSWDVSSVESMDKMFWGATLFNQNLGPWDVSLVKGMATMFSGGALSTANYDSLLVAWSKLELQKNVSLHAGKATYTASAERQKIIETFNWTILDGGEEINSIISHDPLDVASNPIGVDAHNLYIYATTPYTLLLFAPNGKIVKEISSSARSISLASLGVSSGVYAISIEGRDLSFKKSVVIP